MTTTRAPRDPRADLRARAQLHLDAWRRRQAEARPHGELWRQAQMVIEVLEELLAPGGAAT